MIDKPFRTFSGRPTPDRVAKGLLMAERLGDRWAAHNLGVHFRTLQNWRARYLTDPEVQAEMARLRTLADAEWLKVVTDARYKLLARVTELAGASRKLRDVTDAFRRVNEAVIATEILKSDTGDALIPDAERDEPDHGGPPKASQGADDGPPDDDEDDPD